MNLHIVEVADAVRAERLRQAQATAAGRRLRAGRRPRGVRPVRHVNLMLLAVVILVLAIGGTATAAS